MFSAAFRHVPGQVPHGRSNGISAFVRSGDKSSKCRNADIAAHNRSPGTSQTRNTPFIQKKDGLLFFASFSSSCSISSLENIDLLPFLSSSLINERNVRHELAIHAMF